MSRHVGNKAAFSLQQIYPRSQGRNLRSQRANLVRGLVRRLFWGMTWGIGHARTLTHLLFGAKFLFGNIHDA